MKAISLKQPWGWLVVTERKTIETRTWSTSYRGDLLICASKKPTSNVALRNWFQESFGCWAMLQLRCGVALCIAKLIDCRPMTKADEKAAMCELYPGAYAWLLADIQPIEPFAVKGSLDLYEVPLPESMRIEK